MRNENLSGLEKWRLKYGALITSLSCLYGAIMSWGNNWILTIILGLGVFICGIIGIFDLKRAVKKKAKPRY